MRRSRMQFTLWRAMALVAVLAVVWWIIGAVRENQARAERDLCRIALWQLVVAVCGYQAEYGSFPPGTLPGAAVPPEQRVSWVPLILNWTDFYQSIRYLFDPDRPWDAAENRLPRIRFSDFPEPDHVVSSPGPPELPRGLGCPANHCKIGPGLPGPIHYVGIAGLGIDAPKLPSGHPRAGVFGYDRQTRISDITDGASATMLLAETTFANGPWTAGGAATVRGVDPGRQPFLGAGRQFGGAHRGGAMVAFADGSVRFVRKTIDPKTFEALATVAGGEVLPDGWDR